MEKDVVATFGAGACIVITGVFIWWMIQDNRRANERHELGKKMNQAIYDRMIISNMEIQVDGD